MRIRPVVAAASLALALAACEARGGDDVRDSRAPDAVGTVTSVEDATGVIAVGFAPDPGDEYFEGTVFEFAEQGGLEGPGGEALGGSDVSVGDRLEVWVEECAESFPVQCSDPVGRLLP
ncbi:hypothetical protein QQX09_03230 [Demequina sp. SYSU T00192]|uniref:DUF5666 domain-containing protein n=1 Tax=Demequina litoralis TaxID=3051660 RepID=A0ABT8G6T7_9MICO|nr:hypothetical protein [Demequina sp. SYSU T00192]MDN4474866.1 hypothetical protein [Demequina sp. SYSU T00192]